ncbi:MAG: hypothetical protein WD648_13035 [Planctomycetaceae bacterium]
MPADAVMERVSSRTSTPCPDELYAFVQSRTQRRVKDLKIDARDGCVTVTGRSATYYVKQLVTQAIMSTAPSVRLDNRIIV